VKRDDGGVVPPKDECDSGSPHGGVFVHPQILALGMKPPLTAFVRIDLGYFRVALS